MKVLALVAMVGAMGALGGLALVSKPIWSVGPLTSDLINTFWLFVCLSIATVPVWFWSARQPLSALRQVAACAGLLVVGLLVTPEFAVKIDPGAWTEDDRGLVSVVWIKRSLLDTIDKPKVELDELAWLQSGFSPDLVPAQVYCPRRSTRLYPLFGVVRDDRVAKAIWRSRERGTDRPDPVILANSIARCNREGPAMRAAGHTKESALMQGDVDRFFRLNALADPPGKSVVLEDAEVPPHLMARIDALLRQRSPRLDDYLDGASVDAKMGIDARIDRGRVRRFTTLAVAEALGRAGDLPASK